MKLPSDYLEQGWTQHIPACDEEGNQVNEEDGSAVRWCHIGAASASLLHGKYANKKLHKAYQQSLESIFIERYGIKSISNVNDCIYTPRFGQSQAVSDAREAERKVGLR